ncbi:MAG: hypothetical protein IJZ23_08800 [Roseburia sp.]|nr:hypothetical protein [Roseburia sp.]
MKRMWQKYTPAKRVLALLLAVLMMFDTFTVSAATTEDASQSVEQEVVVEEVETTESTATTEEDLVEEETTQTTETEPVEENETTEVVTTEVEEAVAEATEAQTTEVETTENEETQVIEGELDIKTADALSNTAIVLTDNNWEDPSHIYYSNVVNYWMSTSYDYTNSISFCVRLDPNEVDITLEPVVTVEADGGWFNVGQEVPMYGYNIDDDGYAYYYRTIYGGGESYPYAEFESGTVTVAVGEDVRKFEFVRGDLAYTMDQTTKYMASYSSNYAFVAHEGDQVALTSKNHQSGAFGYITFKTGGMLEASDITDATAQAAWDANYASTYGTYGADGKYYFFTYGDGLVWAPTLTAVSKGVEEINYTVKNAAGEEELVTYTTMIAPEYYVMCGDATLVRDGVTSVPYTNGDLRFYLYSNGAKVSKDAANVVISGWSSETEEALSVNYDENGYWYVEIDAEKVKDYQGNVVDLDKTTVSLHFGISVTDIATSYGEHYSYTVQPKEIAIQATSGNMLIPEGETAQIDFSEDYIGLSLPVTHNDSRYTNPTITYSNSSILKLNAYSGEYSYGSFSMTPLKLGTTKITITYTVDGVKETYTANIEIVSNRELEFGIYDIGESEFVPFENNTLVAELGTDYRFFTSVSPMLLSDIQITPADPSIFNGYGSISESTYEENGRIYRSRRFATGRGQNIGETTLTFSAKYNGKTVTQVVNVQVVEPKGVNVKGVSVNTWGDETYQLQSKVTNLYLDNSSRNTIYAICDDVVVGYDDDGNPIYENTFADKDNYEIGIYSGSDDTKLDYLSVEFINESIFCIVPNEASLPSDNVFGLTLRVTSKEDSTKVTEVQINYETRALLYESYDAATGKLSGKMEAIPVIAGADNKVYMKVGAGYTEAELKDLYLTNIEHHNITANAKIVESGETRTVIEITFNYTPDGSSADWFYTYINAGDYYASTEAYIYPMEAAVKAVPGFSQKEVSEFYRAADATEDIAGGMRMGDCEYAFKTINGEKVAIVVGYLGNEEQAFIEKSIWMPVIVSEGDSYIAVVNTEIPIIGVEDGAFDTRNGYVEPDIITFYAGHTYFGANESGLVNPNGGRVSFDWWSNDAVSTEDMAFEIYDGMLFVKEEDGSYKCIDTGNLSVAPIIKGEVTLYLNSPAPSCAIDFRKSSNVVKYVLASDCLLDENGAATVLNVTNEGTEYDPKYVVSVAKGTEVVGGTYYLALTPYVEMWTDNGWGETALPTIKAKVAVDAQNTAPTVTIDNEITINKYLGTDAIQPLNESNSFGTQTTVTIAADSVAAANAAGISFVLNGDGKYLVYWDGTSELPATLELELAFAVEGFTATDDMYIPNQVVTIKAIDVQPTTVADINKVSFDEYPYPTKAFRLDTENGFVNSTPKSFTVKPVSAPKGVDLEEVGEYITLSPAGTEDSPYYGIVVVDVSNDTTPGTYEFEITAELSTEKKQYFATPVKVAIVVNGKKPTIGFAEKANVTLDAICYNTDAELPSLVQTSGDTYSVAIGALAQVNTEVTSKPKGASDAAVVVRAIYGAPVGTDDMYSYFTLSNIKLVADVAKDAPAGTYKFDINVPLCVEGDIVWASVAASVNVTAKLPTFKLSSGTATLDASYVGSGAGVTLALTPGYSLSVSETTIVAPNVESEYCVNAQVTPDGGIHFTLVNAGIAKGGKYTITPVVVTGNGEKITLKPISVNLKITNSEKATLNAKTKNITVNPYIGYTTVDPQFTLKNATATDGVYEVIPTSEASRMSGMSVSVNAEGKLTVSGCENVADGKYTYNVVQKIGDICSKPVTITVQVVKKPLEIVPYNSKVTLHADYCDGFPVEVELGGEVYEIWYITAEIPVEIKGAEDMNLMDYLTEDELGLTATNDLYEDWGIITYFDESTTGTGDTSLYAVIPYGITPNNIVITPHVAPIANKEIADLKMNITVVAGKPTTAFEEKTVTLNRFETDTVFNAVGDVKGCVVSDLYVDSVTLKGEDVSSMFNFAVGGSVIGIQINENYIDSIPNGTYKVTVTPIAKYADGFQEDGETIYYNYRYMESCSFEIKIEDTKPNIVVSEKAVSLFADLAQANTDSITVSATSGDTELVIDSVTATTTGKVAITDTESGNTVTFTSDPSVTKGSNKYDITVYAKRYGSETPIAIGTVKNAVTVNVKTLPASLKTTNAKLKFNPYTQNSVSVEVNDAELKALIESGNYSYAVSMIETDKSYKMSIGQNEVLAYSGTGDGKDGTITFTAKSLPTEKATYYYQATYVLHKNDDTSLYKTYTVNMSVAVDNTKPVAQVDKKSISLNNAALDQGVAVHTSLKTGADVWTPTASGWDYTIIDGKKNNVTDLFEVYVADGRIEVFLRPTDETGKVISVPKGNYTLTVTPQVTDGTNTIELADLKITIKVVSSKPAYVKNSVSVTVNTWSNDVVESKVALKNGGTFEGTVTGVPTKFPNGADTSKVTVKLAADGTLTAVATRDAMAGSYTYEVTPVTKINGWNVMLDPLKVSVKVDATKPKAVISNKGTATLNTKFAGFYSEDLELSLPMSKYDFVIDKDDIRITDKKDAVKANAQLLLDAMTLIEKEDGTVVINVNMNGAAASVPKGTYNFAITPMVETGDHMTAEDTAAYELAEIKFKVKVEEKLPTVSAKATGSIELLDRSGTAVDVQLSFSKQNYETVDNITSVALYEKGQEDETWRFYINSDLEELKNGKFSVRAEWCDLEAKTHSLEARITTESGNEYVAKFSVKTTQANVKVVADKKATYYAQANVGEIPVAASDEEVWISDANLTAVTLNGKKLDVNAFDAYVTWSDYYQGQIIQLQSSESMSEHVGETLKCTFEVYLDGQASNKKPAKVTVELVIE